MKTDHIAILVKDGASCARTAVVFVADRGAGAVGMTTRAVSEYPWSIVKALATERFSWA